MAGRGVNRHLGLSRAMALPSGAGREHEDLLAKLLPMPIVATVPAGAGRRHPSQPDLYRAGAGLGAGDGRVGSGRQGTAGAAAPRARGPARARGCGRVSTRRPSPSRRPAASISRPKLCALTLAGRRQATVGRSGGSSARCRRIGRRHLQFGCGWRTSPGRRCARPDLKSRGHAYQRHGFAPANRQRRAVAHPSARCRRVAARAVVLVLAHNNSAADV